MESFLNSSKNESSSSFKRNIRILGIIGLLGIVGAFVYLQSSRAFPFLTQYSSEESEFQEFIEKYNKEYTPDEYRLRFEIFKGNLAFIRAQNSLNLDWVLGVNQFADLTPDEFKKNYLSPIEPSYNLGYEKQEKLKIPTSIDWNQLGAVTQVQAQGKCKASYAFAAAGAVEGAWKIFNGTLVFLSEQEIVDCSKNFGNHGCDGGSVDGAFRYMIKNGITSGYSYFYTAKEGKCNTTLASESIAEIGTFTNVNPNDTVSLKNAVAVQPVAANVQADQAVWTYYKGGVVTSNCGLNLDLSVLITGYNLTTTPNYWIVKNSWGMGWGEFGYIRIAIKSGPGVCGIQMEPSYPNAVNRS